MPKRKNQTTEVGHFNLPRRIKELLIPKEHTEYIRTDKVDMLETMLQDIAHDWPPFSRSIPAVDTLQKMFPDGVPDFYLNNVGASRQEDPSFGYYVNGDKAWVWVVVKKERIAKTEGRYKISRQGAAAAYSAPPCASLNFYMPFASSRAAIPSFDEENS